MEIKEKTTKINQLIDEINSELTTGLSSISDEAFAEIVGMLTDTADKIDGVIDSICEDENSGENEDEN